MPDITITWADVTALAPELASVGLATQSAVLAQVGLEVTTGKWGSLERANTAAAWLARHLGATFATGGGGSGELQSVSVGGVSKSYATSGGTDLSSLRSTKYGREYLRLVRKWMPRMLVI